MKMSSFKEDNRITKIFGPPGTGKTTWILSKVEELLSKGIEPNRIALVSFTNKAVDEFVTRALKKFNKYSKEDFPWFRTIHSLCNKCGNGRKILTQPELTKFAKSLGLDVSSFVSIEDGMGVKSGDKLIQMENLSRLTMKGLKETFDENDTDFSYEALCFWSTEYNKFKDEKKVVDFTDLLSNFNSTIDVDYFFIDEAQDLSLLQWKVMEKACGSTKEIYISGDDDQCIFNFAGSSADYFLNIYNKNDIVLSKSYRLPLKIFDKSKEILKNITKRKEKEYYPDQRTGEGNIIEIGSLGDIEFKKEEEYLILFRNRWISKETSQELKERGIPFTIFGKNSMGEDLIKAILVWEEWRKKQEQIPRSIVIMLSKYSNLFKKELSEKEKEKPWFEIFDLVDFYDKEYIRQCLKNGYKLNQEPKIILSTIHQAKGGESENVIIFPTVSETTFNSINTEEEHKVWYVAMTRSKKNLFLVFPQSLTYYNL